MRITLSCAVTADGFLDDATPQRLIVSTPGDWADVYRLRADHDAILVGAETLRRDDPALLLHDEQARAARTAAGLRPDLAKATLTCSGDLPRALRFFREGDADRYVFSQKELPEIENIASVISCEGRITSAAIVTELEKRGIERLLVEGGASTLSLFLREGMADTLRLAVNPAIRLGEKGGVRFPFDAFAEARCCLHGCVGEAPAPTDRNIPFTCRRIDGMEVTTFTLRPDTSRQDVPYLQMAVDESRRCAPCPTSYCVGAVIVTPDGRVFKGFTHETSPTHHAEQEAVGKALSAGASLRGATIYSSMEPCSRRASEPESCTAMILRHGFARVVFALYEPDRFVYCRGALTLREAGVEVRAYPSLADEVRAVNAHLRS